MYYTDNKYDSTSVEEFAKTIINKLVTQFVNTDVFDDIFTIFDRKIIDGAGYQAEELEVGNITPTDFDPTGANALKKADNKITALYHKINRDKIFKATTSFKQLRTAMLSKENTASLVNAILSELSNSSAIADYEAMKQLLTDILTTKKIVVADLNGNGEDMNNLTKTIQILADNMELPSTKYNYLGFKKEFNKKEELVLITDTSHKARLNVDVLANAFHMDKKHLVGNIIALDELPKFELTSEDCAKQIELNIGTAQPVIVAKPQRSGGTAVTGKIIGILLNKKAIIRDKVTRDVDTDKNGEGRFMNHTLNAVDVLSYSPLKNAIVLVD